MERTVCTLTSLNLSPPQYRECMHLLERYGCPECARQIASGESMVLVESHEDNEGELRHDHCRNGHTLLGITAVKVLDVLRARAAPPDQLRDSNGRLLEGQRLKRAIAESQNGTRPGNKPRRKRRIGPKRRHSPLRKDPRHSFVTIQS